MSRVVDSLPERVSGPKPKYPWQEWMDGRIWEITRGEDFAVPVSSMRTMLRTRGTAHGLRLEERATGDVLTFQFTPQEAES